MNQIPEADFRKLVQISGNPDATPPVPVIIPFSQDIWHVSVKPGRYPGPVYIVCGRGAFYCVGGLCALIASAGASS